MYDQPKATTYSENDFFSDRRSARPLVPGTVARGHLREDAVYETGIGPDGAFVAVSPVPLSRALMDRGRERFEIFCSPCHGRTGEGNGMIVQRGFKAPPRFQDDRLRDEPIGYFFDVMTNGFGDMSSYAVQVPAADRWAIAAYIRALQLAGHAPAAALTAADLRALAAGSAGPSDREARPAVQGEGGPAESGPGGAAGAALPPPSKGEHRDPREGHEAPR